MGFQPTQVIFPARTELPSGVANFTLPGWASGTAFNRTHVADTLYFIPIFVARATTFDRVGVDVDVAAAGGSVLRMGLHAADQSTLLPTALLNDFGTVLVDSAGEKLITIALTLQRGYYLTAHITDGVPQLTGFSSGAVFESPVQAWEESGVSFLSQIVRRISGRTGDAVGGLVDPAPATNGSETPTFAAVRLRSTP